MSSLNTSLKGSSGTNIYESLLPLVQTVSNNVLINNIFTSNDGGVTGFTDKNIVIGNNVAMPNTQFEVDGNTNIHGDDIEINTINTGPSIVNIGNSQTSVNLSGAVLVNGGPILSGASFKNTNSIDLDLVGNDVYATLNLDNSTIPTNSTPIFNQITSSGLNSSVPNSSIRQLLNGLAPIEYNNTTGQISVLVGTTAGTVAAGNDPRFTVPIANTVRVVNTTTNPIEFTSIRSAVNSIPTTGATAPSQTNPWAVLVYPGEYSEVTTITPPPFVYIVGVSMEGCVVQPAATGYNLFNLTNNTGIAFMTLTNVEAPNNALYFHDAADFALAHKVNITESPTAIFCTTTTSVSYIYLEYISGNSTPTYFLQCTDDGTHQNIVSCENFFTFGASANAVLLNGTHTQLLLQAGVFQDGSGGNALHCTNGANMNVRATYIEGFAIGVYADSGANNSILLLSSILFNNCTTNINVANATVTGHFDGFSEYNKTIINESSLFFIANKNRQVITVGYKGTDFTSVATAINSITDNSATNSYVIAVGPGIYNEPPIIMKPYVVVSGSGNLNTIINCTNASGIAITGCDYSEINNCLIGGVPNGTGVYHQGSGTLVPFIIKNCSFGDCNTLVHTNGSNNVTFTYVLDSQFGGTYTCNNPFILTNTSENVTITTTSGSNIITSAGLFTPSLNELSISGTGIPIDTFAFYINANEMALINSSGGSVTATQSGSITAIFSVLASLILDNFLFSAFNSSYPTTLVNVSGYNSVLLLYNSIFVLTNGSGTNGVQISNGGEGRLYDSSFRGLNIAIQVLNGGNAPYLTASSLNFEFCTLNLSVEHPGTTGTFVGITDITKVAIYPGAEFSMVDRVSNRYTVAVSGGDFTSIGTATSYLLPKIQITGNGTTTVTSSFLFTVRLIGATVTGTNIPANTTVTAYTNMSTITLSNTIPSGTITATFEISVPLAQLVEVYPGDYVELQTILVPQNCTVAGQDYVTTVVIPGGAFNLFQLSANSQINNITITNTQPGYYGAYLHDVGFGGTIKGVAFVNCPNCVYADAITQAGEISIIDTYAIGSMTAPFTFTDAGSGQYLSVAIEDIQVSGVFNSCVSLSGPNVEVSVQNSSIIGEGVGNGFIVYNGGQLKARSIFISGVADGFITGDMIANSPSLILSGIIFDTSNTLNINIINRTTTGHYDGFSQYNKTIVDPFSSFFISNTNTFIVTVGSQGSNFTTIGAAVSAINPIIEINCNSGVYTITPVIANSFTAALDGITVVDINNTGTIPPNTIATFVDSSHMTLSNAPTNTAEIYIEFQRATSTTPYIVSVGPGNYEESATITVPSNVIIIGSSYLNVVIIPNGNFDMFYLSSSSGLQNISIHSVNSSNLAVTTFGATDILLQNVTFVNCPQCMLFEGSSSLNSQIDIINCYAYGNDMTTCVKINDEGSSYEINVILDNFIFTNLNGQSSHADNCIIVYGPNAYCYVKDSYCIGNGLGNFGNVQNGGNLEIIGSIIQMWGSVAITGDSITNNPSITIISTDMSNTTGLAINITNPSTTGHVDGYVPYSSVYINTSSSFFITGKDRNILTVAKRGGDFTSINAALAAINTQTSTNQFIISVGPGVFNETPITMKSYVSITGSGATQTIVNCTTPTGYAITGADSCELNNLTIQGANGSGGVGIYYSGTGLNQSFFVTNCVLGDNQTLVWVEANTSVASLVMTSSYATSPPSTITCFKVTSPNNILSEIIAISCGVGLLPPSNATQIALVSDPYSMFSISNTYFICETTGTNGVVVQNGATVLMTAVQFNGFNIGLQTLNSGTGPTIDSTGTIFLNCTTEISIENPNTTGTLLGVVDMSKIFINPNSSFYIRDRQTTTLLVNKHSSDYITIASAIQAINPMITITTNGTTTITSNGQFNPSFNGFVINAADITPGTTATFVNQNTMILSAAATGSHSNETAQVIRATSLNTFIISVDTGIYTETALILPNYTSLIGVDRTQVTIQPSSTSQTMIKMAIQTAIANLTIQGATSGIGVLADSVQINNQTPYSRITQCSIYNCATGIKCTSTTSLSEIFVNEIEFGGALTTGIFIDGTTANTGSNAVKVDLHSIYFEIGGNNITTIFVEGQNAQAYISILRMNGNSYTGITGISISDGAYVNVTASNILNCDQYGLIVNNVGAGPILNFMGVIFSDNAGFDIDILHPSTIGVLSIEAQRSKVSINSASTITVDYIDPIAGGTTITGPLYLGNTNSTVADVSNLIQDVPCMGLVQGGIITVVTGLEVNISSGFGYLVTGTPPTAQLFRISWNSTNLILPASTTNYIYYDSTSTLNNNSARPSTINTILLGRVRADSTGIEFIDAAPMNAYHIDNSFDDYEREVFGSIFASGSLVTSNTSLQLSVSSGRYYFAENVYTPSGSAFPLTFTSYAHNGGNTFTLFPNQTVVDNTQYDNGTNLIPLGAPNFLSISVTLNGTTTITSTALFTADLVGSTISGVGIPNNTTVTTFTNTSSIIISNAATTSGTTTATFLSSIQVSFGAITTTITSATGYFTSAMVGATISGTNIPSGTTITTFNSANSITISATTTNTTTVTEVVKITEPNYVKHSLYLVGQGVNEQYFLIYGQAQYTTLSAANAGPLPLPPTYFIEGVVVIASIIVQEGNSTFTQIASQRPLPSFNAASLSSSIYHSSLLGLLNDDHPQYVLTNGNRVMTGNLNLGGNSVINVNLVDGVVVHAHASRHLPNGADPITTAAPITDLNANTTNSAGTANSFARSDHTHAIDTGTPVALTPNAGNSSGSAATLVRSDHVHNIPTATPVSIGSTNIQSQTGASSFAQSDHVHQGVHSLTANTGGTERFGDVVIQQGVGTTVVDNGSGTFTIDTTYGPNELYVTAGSGLVANYTKGRVNNFGTIVNISAGSITLPASTTNGTIFVNTSNVVAYSTDTIFGENTIAMAIFTTSSSAITSLTDARSFVATGIRVGNGNMIIVDTVKGDDTTGQRQGSPFKTITAGLAVALSGDEVHVNPGTYNEGNLNIPTGVALIGSDALTTVISQTNVTSSTTMITMNTNTRLENFVVTLTSATSGNILTGILFSATSSATAKISTCTINVTNTTTGIANINGIHSNGTGTQNNPTSFAIKTAVINVTATSATSGNVIAVLLDSTSPNSIYSRDSIIQSTTGGGAAGIGVQTTGTSTPIFYALSCQIRGTTNDYIQTVGSVLLSSTNLSTGTAFTATSNQIVLNNTETITLNAVQPTASRIYTIPDVGSASTFVTTAGSQVTSTGGTILITPSTNTLNIDINSSGSSTFNNIILSAAGSSPAAIALTGNPGVITSSNALNLQPTGNFSVSPTTNSSTITLGTTTETGTITVGQSSATNIVNVGSGSGATTLNLATGSGGNTVNIANGAGPNSVTLGSTNTTSTTTIESGSGGLNLGTSTEANTINIGAVSNAARTINIGTSAQANQVDIGSTTATTTITGTINLPSELNDGAVYIDGSHNLKSAPLTDGQLLIGSTIGVPAAANITSNGGTITVTNGHNSINVDINSNSGPTLNNLILSSSDSSPAALAFTGNPAVQTSTNSMTIQTTGSNTNLTLAPQNNILLQPATAAGQITLGTTSETGTITIGQSTAGQNVSIASGNNTVAQTITLANGNNAASSTVDIAAGNPSSGTQTVNILNGTSTGGTQTLNLGNANSPIGINLGNGTGAATIGIGNTTSATSVNIESGSSGSLLVGNSATSQNITVGNTTGSTVVTLESGSGGLNLGASNEANTINIGAVSNAARTINIGTSAQANQVDIGSTTATTTITGTINLPSELNDGAVYIDGSHNLKSAPLTDGQLLIGSTIGVPAAANITSNSGTMTITNGHNSINIDISTTASATMNNLILSASGSSPAALAFTGSPAVQTSTNSMTIQTTGSNTNLTLNPQNNILLQPTTAAGQITLGTTSETGTITVGQSTAGQNVSIASGNNTVAQTITLANGNNAANSTVNIAAGNPSSGTQTVNILNGTSTGGTQTLNLGNAGSAIGINIGNSTGTSTIGLGSGSGASNISVGNINGASSITERVGTGNYSLDGVGASTYSISQSTTTGTITIGGTAQTGTLTVGQSSATNTVNLGNGTGATTLNIGNGASGASSNIVTIGSTNSASKTTLESGSGGINLGTTNDANTINIGSVSNGARNINIGTSSQANTVDIGSSTAITTITGTTNLASLSADGVLYLNGSNNVSSTVLTNGQLLIGSTGSIPVAGNITSNGGTITVTNGAGSINVENTMGNTPFGSGADGNVTISTNTTLSSDMYYSSLTVNSNIILNSGGYAIYVAGTCTINGSISNNGGAGGNSSGGSVGSSGIGAAAGSLGSGANGASGVNTSSNGNNGNNIVYSGGSTGGSGGNTSSTAHTGGSGGTVTVPPSTAGGIYLFTKNTNPYTHLRALDANELNGGSGGGSGAVGGSSSGSGGGGGGGGIILIIAKNFAGTGSITANGGNAGTPSGTSQVGGSGGGGGGFIMTMSHDSPFPSTLTRSVTGGIASSGINGGNNGVNGLSGTIIHNTI